MVEQRASLDERIARLEVVIEGIGRRLDSLERRLDSLETRLDSGLRELRQRQDRFIWIVLAAWVTIILAIMLRT